MTDDTGGVKPAPVVGAAAENHPPHCDPKIESCYNLQDLILFGSIPSIVILYILLVYCVAKVRKRCLESDGAKSGEDSVVEQELKRAQEELRRQHKDVIVKSEYVRVDHNIPIGAGQFSCVYAGKIEVPYRDPSQTKKVYRYRSCGVAVKQVNQQTPQNFLSLLKEALAICKLQHDHVVSLQGLCMESQYGPMIIMEFCNGGSLKEHLGHNETMSPYTYCTMIRIMSQVASAVSFLHSQGHVHRDIAARNVLLTTDHLPTATAKLADFGMAVDQEYYKMQNPYRLLPVAGMTPEVFLYQMFCPASDVWAFGMLLWEVFTVGGMPMEGLTLDEIHSRVISPDEHQRCLPRPPDTPWPIYKIMLSCWRLAYGTRPAQTNIEAELSALSPSLEPVPIPNLPLQDVVFGGGANLDLSQSSSKYSAHRHHDVSGGHIPMDPSPRLSSAYSSPPASAVLSMPSSPAADAHMSPPLDDVHMEGRLVNFTASLLRPRLISDAASSIGGVSNEGYEMPMNRTSSVIQSPPGTLARHPSTAGASTSGTSPQHPHRPPQKKPSSGFIRSTINSPITPPSPQQQQPAAAAAGSSGYQNTPPLPVKRLHGQNNIHPGLPAAAAVSAKSPTMSDDNQTTHSFSSQAMIITEYEEEPTAAVNNSGSGYHRSSSSSSGMAPDQADAAAVKSVGRNYRSPGMMADEAELGGPPRNTHSPERRKYRQQGNNTMTPATAVVHSPQQQQQQQQRLRPRNLGLKSAAATHYREMTHNRLRRHQQQRQPVTPSPSSDNPISFRQEPKPPSLNSTDERVVLEPGPNTTDFQLGPLSTTTSTTTANDARRLNNHLTNNRLNSTCSDMENHELNISSSTSATATGFTHENCNIDGDRRHQRVANVSSTFASMTSAGSSPTSTTMMSSDSADRIGSSSASSPSIKWNPNSIPHSGAYI